MVTYTLLLSGRRLRLYRAQLIAFRAHAEIGEARFFDEAVLERIRRRPDGKAPALCVADHYRGRKSPRRHPRPAKRLLHRFDAALLRIPRCLVGAAVRPYPLHWRAG